MVEGETPDEGLFPQGVGERLRAAREKAGLDLNDIGTRTRIPLRHLEAIERDDFAALPSPTYALGFTRSYARALGVEDAALVRRLREQLGREDPDVRNQMPYEPVDPTRVPSRLLMWTAVALAALLIVGYSVWRTQFYGTDAAPPVAEAPPGTAAPPSVTDNAATPAPAAASPATGEVVLTATAPVWLRIYDATKTKLFEKEMAVGERYVVPADANDPKILTGRPDALTVTVGGQQVAPLGEPEKTIRDVGVSAAALAGRTPAPAPTTPTDNVQAPQ